MTAGPSAPLPPAADRAAAELPLDAGRQRDARRRRFVVAGCAVLAVVLAVLVATMLWVTRGEFQQSAERINGTLALLLKEQTEAALADDVAILSATVAALARWRAIGGPGSDAANAALHELIQGRPRVAALWILDATGRATHHSDARAALGDQSDRAFFTLHRDEQAAALPAGTARFTIAPDSRLVEISTALRGADGRLEGIVVAALDIQHLQDIWDQVDLGPGGSIALLRRDGTVLLRSPALPGTIGRKITTAPAFAGLVAAAPAGNRTLVSSVDGVRRLISHRILPAFPDLVLVIGRPTEVIDAPWRRYAIFAVTFWLVAMTAIGALAYWLMQIWKREWRIESRFHQLAEAMPALVYIAAPDGNNTFVNRRWTELTGLPPEAATTRPWDDFVHPDDAAPARARWREALATGSDHRVEYRLRCVDGGYRWQLSRATPVRDEAGRIRAWYGAAVDIDDIKQAEARLGAAEARYRRMFETLPVAALETGADGKIAAANPAARRLFGFGETEDLSEVRAADRYADPVDRTRIFAEHMRRSGAPHTVEVRRRRRDGSVFWAEQHVSAELGTDGEPRLLHSVIIDITDRKLREEHEAARRASELNYRALIEASAAAIMALDPAGNVTLWNPAAEKLFGYTSAEVLGKPAPTIPPGREKAYYARLADVMKGCVFLDEELRRRTKDGRPITVSIRIAPTYGADGKPNGVISILTDMTERQALEAQLRQAQKMEAVGQLTGGIAHDFNNLLTVILGNAGVLTRALGDRPALRSLAEMIDAAGQRGADLTRSLLAFARKQALEPKPTDVNQLIMSLDELLRRALGEQIDIDIVSGHDLRPAMVDSARIEAAILNLAVNARDAMPNGGKLTIETSNAVLDDDYALHNQGAEPGSYVMIAVSDSGIGMAPDVLAKAFDPFFTTKEAGKGSGLGLSMVYGLIRQSNGHIKLYSEPGYGTTVKLYLPRAAGASADGASEDGASADARAPHAPTEARGGDETILLVEDDELVRRYAEDLLRGFGYRLHTAGNGPEALEILRRNPAIDLLFTDVVMPGGLYGPDLAAEARRLRPGLKVLYTSGYTDNAIIHQGRLDPGVDLLSKPYRPQQLAAKLREVLGDKPVAG